MYSFSATSGIPSLFTSGKIPAFTGANCGLIESISVVPCRSGVRR